MSAADDSTRRGWNEMGQQERYPLTGGVVHQRPTLTSHRLGISTVHSLWTQATRLHAAFTLLSEKSFLIDRL